MSDEVKCVMFGVGLLIGLAIIVAVCGAYMEARTFNKFSSVKATTWDALWTELRVIPN